MTITSAQDSRFDSPVSREAALRLIAKAPADLQPTLQSLARSVAWKSDLLAYSYNGSALTSRQDPRFIGKPGPDYFRKVASELPKELQPELLRLLEAVAFRKDLLQYQSVTDTTTNVDIVETFESETIGQPPANWTISSGSPVIGSLSGDKAIVGASFSIRQNQASFADGTLTMTVDAGAYGGIGAADSTNIVFRRSDAGHYFITLNNGYLYLQKYTPATGVVLLQSVIDNPLDVYGKNTYVITLNGATITATMGGLSKINYTDPSPLLSAGYVQVATTNYNPANATAIFYFRAQYTTTGVAYTYDDPPTQDTRFTGVRSPESFTKLCSYWPPLQQFLQAVAWKSDLTVPQET